MVHSAMSMSMSKIFIGGAVCFEDFESEAPVAEEMLHYVVCSRQQYAVSRCALKVVMVVELCVTGDKEISRQLEP